tara:strand:+ start:4623 stop:5084 length:462 start_codon:yes stop_codon:yes gene_type:complete
MSRQNWGALDCAMQYLGIKEVPGHKSNPAILAMLQMDMKWPKDDATPWCSAFANWVAFNMGLERSKSLRARSWLLVGKEESLEGANANCVVIFKRGRGRQPGPDVIKAPGHVAFFSHLQDDKVWVVGGNQGDKVSIKAYPLTQVLGVRRLRRV